MQLRKEKVFGIETRRIHSFLHSMESVLRIMVERLISNKGVMIDKSVEGKEKKGYPINHHLFKILRRRKITDI